MKSRAIITKPGEIKLTSYFLIARLVLGEQQGLCNVYSAPRSNKARALAVILLSATLLGAGPAPPSVRSDRISRPPATGYFSVETFSLPAYLGGQPALVFSMDFDHDGDLDVVIAETLIPPAPAPYGNGRMIAFRNDGHGHFSDATNAVFRGATVDTGFVLLVADFNKDGRQDLFAPCWGNDRDPSVGAQDRIFIQTPQGRLADETKSRLPVLLDFSAYAAIGDVDADGDTDIFIPKGGLWPITPHFLINNGKGYFTYRNDLLPADMIASDYQEKGQNYDSSVFLDVDKDGDLDLALGAMPIRARHQILLNDGKGTYSHAPDGSMPPRLFGKLGCADTVLSEDFNEDGWPDLMIDVYKGWSSDPGRAELYLNNCDGTFRDATKNMPYAPTGAWSRATVDMNGDGWMDYFDADVNGGTGLKIFLNKGNAQFIEMSRLLLPKTSDGRGPSEAYPFDADGDGDIDIFGVANPGQDEFGNVIPGVGFVYLNLKGYAFSTKILFPALLQAPKNGATDMGASVVLRWTDSNTKPRPEETQYQVRIKRAGGNYAYYNVKKGRAYLKLSGLASGATYSWNVKAVGDGKDIQDSAWAASEYDWTFTTR